MILEFFKLSLNDMLYSLFIEKFVEEVKYCQWFQDFVSDKDLSDINEYRKNGVFASGVGDIIVDACANILCIPIVVISSIDNMAVKSSSNPHPHHGIIKSSLFSVQCRRTKAL